METCLAKPTVVVYISITSKGPPKKSYVFVPRVKSQNDTRWDVQSIN